MKTELEEQLIGMLEDTTSILVTVCSILENTPNYAGPEMARRMKAKASALHSQVQALK